MKYVVSLNGKDYEVEVERGQAMLLRVSDTAAAAAPAPAAPAPVPAAPAAPASAPAPAPAAPAAAAGGEIVPSPLPGTVLAVRKKAGDAVKRGDVILILEAMKMENEIVAPRDGVVAGITVAVGAVVDTGDPLFSLN